MKDISCDVIRDLIPLYIDDICSEQSKRLIEDHIDDCENCRKALECARTNISSDQSEITPDEQVGPENPFVKVKRKHRICVAVAIVVTIFIMTVFWLLVENVGYLNQHVFENSSFTVSIDNNDVWTEIGDFKSDALVFKHKITNDANSTGGCHIRIKTGDDHVIDEYYIKNGNSISAKLKRGKRYSVEIRADKGQYFINMN